MLYYTYTNIYKYIGCVLLDLREGIKIRSVYPWEQLNKVGDCFEWENIEDASRIRCASYTKNFKVSVRTINNKLVVVRIS